MYKANVIEDYFVSIFKHQQEEEEKRKLQKEQEKKTKEENIEKIKSLLGKDESVIYDFVKKIQDSNPCFWGEDGPVQLHVDRIAWREFMSFLSEFENRMLNPPAKDEMGSTKSEHK